MEKNNDLLLRAAKILKANGKAESVYFTHDGSAFVNEKNAKTHAKTLPKTELVTVTKEEAEGAEQGTEANNPGVVVELTIQDADALGKLNKEKLLAQVALREGLTVAPDATKRVIIDAILAFDAAKAAEAAAGAEANTTENNEGADAGNEAGANTPE